LGQISVIPELDLAAGIKAKEISCQNCIGGKTTTAPSQINIYDLKNNNHQTIFQTIYLLSDPMLSPNGKKLLVKQERPEGLINLIFDVETYQQEKTFGKNLDILGMAQNGNTVLIKKENQYKLINLKTDTETVVLQDIIKKYQIDNLAIEFLECGYPGTFSCLCNDLF